MREVFKLTGELVGSAGSKLREKLLEYEGVTDVRIKGRGNQITVTVDFNDKGTGDYDDSALFILERHCGMPDVVAERLPEGEQV